VNQQRDHRGRSLQLVAIFGGIVVGGLLGACYGRQMWLASDGPQQRLEQLNKTLEQKEDFAQQAEATGDLRNAERLRGQLPVILDEIRRTEALQREAAGKDLTIARYVGQLVRFCGDVFLRLLFMIVIPLVFTSMVCGITSLGDVSRLGKVGGWTIFYYLSTAAAAVTLGIFLVQVIQPGTGADDTFAYVSRGLLARQQTSTLDTLLEVVRGTPDQPGSGMVPANIFRAVGETNVLATILFSLLLGGALSTLGEKGKPAVQFFHAANDAVMQIVRLIIRLTPLGVLGLVATQIADSGGGAAFYTELTRLGWFVVTVTVGLLIHFTVLSIVLMVFARRNPLQYIASIAKALLTALSTDSSSATLPVTIECVEESGVSARSAGFVLPLGATINMDGTALYEAVAAIFIAQSSGVHLGGAELVIVFLTATLAAVGAPGIPNAGLVTLLIVLAAVDLPAAGIGTILAIDWFLDRERTTVNVYGDAVGAAIIDRYFGQDDP